MANYFQIFVSLLSILNPFLAIPVYLDITNGLTASEKKSVVGVCGVTVFAILVGFMLIGQSLMQILRIHEYALNMAGGIIVLLIGICMILRPNAKFEAINESKALNPTNRIRSLGISPLALPMLVGPAAIVMVILYGQAATAFTAKLALIGVLTLVSGVVVVVFLLANYIANWLGEMGIVALTKIMGLITAAIACEMLVSGVTGILPLLVSALPE